MQNNACTEQVVREREGGGTERTDAQHGGRAFFSLSEILDVHRKQRRQLVKATEFGEYPIGKIHGVSSLSPHLNLTQFKRLEKAFRLQKEMWL